MIKKLLIYTSLTVGLVSVITSVLFGNEHTLYIKPLFLMLLFVMYTTSVKKFNALLFVCLSSVMVGEMLVSQDFDTYFFYITILFGSFFALGTMLIWPVLAKTKAQHNRIDIVTIVIASTAFIYLVSSVFFLFADTFNAYIPMTFGVFAFCSFVISCFYISGYQKHEKSIFLFAVGMGYTVICLGTVLYEIIIQSTIVLGVVNLVEIAAQFSFVYFLIHISEVYKNKKWLL